MFYFFIFILKKLFTVLNNLKLSICKFRISVLSKTFTITNLEISLLRNNGFLINFRKVIVYILNI